MREGDLSIKTGPRFPGHEMHILSPAGRTEIVGTLSEGHLKVMFDDGSDPIVEEIASSHEKALNEFVENYLDLFSPGE